MAKIISKEEAVKLIYSGSTIMVGGFLNCGTAQGIIDELSKSKINNLTLIANDTSFPDKSYGKLIVNKQVSKVITSHIGTNPETGRQMKDKEIEVVLMPQGSLAEAIRAYGAGLGGIITPTGIGTLVEEGKQKITIKGKEYIIEEAISGDFAIVYADYADRAGNLAFSGSTRNFNTIMPTACKTTIVEAKEIIDGYLDPNDIVVSSIFVDYIVKGE